MSRKLSFAPLVKELRNSIDLLFKARPRRDEDLILKLEEAVTQERDPYLDSRLSLKIYCHRLTGALSARVIEHALLGERLIFAGKVQEKALKDAKPGRRIFRGPNISVMVDEKQGAVSLSFNQVTYRFGTLTQATVGEIH